jgi:Mg2+ and Co2+ transporter CorA
MRSQEAFGDEINESLRRFTEDTGCLIDDLLQEELGVGQWLATGESPANYSHPIARIESHGPLLLVTLAVPSSLHNGIADFTNVLMLAHPRALLSIIRDPKGTYSADFGGRLLTDYNRHTKQDRVFTAGEAVFRAVRACVLSIDVSLRTLWATVEQCLKKLRDIELRKTRVGQDLDVLEAEFGKSLAELKAMIRTPAQLTSICIQIEKWADAREQHELFAQQTVRQAGYLRSRIAQVDAILGTFISDIERAIKRCDDVSKRELLDAQRNNTYWTSALLLPNLIFAFFGQSFLGDANDSAIFWWISGVVLVVYGAGSAYFLLSRNRRRMSKIPQQ